MDKDEVLKLARLARIDLGEGEAEALRNDFDSILGYVSEVKEAHVDEARSERSDFPLINVMRSDENVHESGIYREELLKRAPKSDGKYIKVKKIL